MKKIISAITTLILILNLCPCLNVWAEETAYNPYETITAVSTPSLIAHSGQASGGRVQISQHSAVFANLDFSEGVKSITFSIKSQHDEDTYLRVYIFEHGTITSSDGLKSVYTMGNGWLYKNGTRVAAHYTHTVPNGTYNSWSTPVDITVSIPDGNKYKGKYDLFIGGDKVGGDLVSFKADSMITDITDFGIALTDNSGNTADSVSNAVKVEANADGTLDACDEKNVALELGVYDSDNNLLYKENQPYYGAASQQIETGSIMLNAEYDNQAIMSGAAYAEAYLTIDGRLIKSTTVGTKASETATSESFESGAAASASEGAITVSGKIDTTDENAMIYLKNGDEVLYVRNIQVKNGNFKCEFSPDIPTGEYDVTVIGNKKGKASTTVDFISYKAIIEAINSATSSDEVYSAFEENEAVIGIDLSKADNDKDWIFAQIYNKRDDVKNIAAAGKLFNTYVALSLVNNGDADSAISLYNELLKLPESYKTLYEADDTAENTINSAVAEYIAKNGKITETDEFVNIVYSSFIAPQTITAYKSYDFKDMSDKDGYGHLENDALADLNTATAYAGMKNVDFGTSIPRTVALTYATTMPGKIYICADSKDNIVKTITTTNTVSWTNFVTEHFILTDAEAAKLAGVHDIYVRFVSKGNFKTIAFTNNYVNIESFNVTGYNGSAVTENTAEMTSVSAAANGYIYNGQKNKAVLITSAYDENGALIKIDSDSDSEFDNDSFNRSTSISGLSGVSSVYTVLIHLENDNFESTLKSSMLSRRAKAVTSQEELVRVSDGSVYIYGQLEDASSVDLFVKKQTVGDYDFNNYVLVYNVEANENGVFSYEFKMPASAQSGMYELTAIADNGAILEKAFNFTNTDDAIKALEIINGATSAENFEELLNDPSKNIYGMDLETILDLDLSTINGYNDSDKIYAAAYACMGSGFKSSDDITKAIKNAELSHKLSSNTSASENWYAIVKSNAYNLGISSNEIYTDYFEKFDTDRQAVFNTQLKALSSEATDVDKLVEAIYKATALTGFTKELSWGKIDGMLNAFEDIFEAAHSGYKTTLALYNKLITDKKHTVCSNYVEKTGLSLKAIASNLSSYYSAVNVNYGGSTVVSGSGGTGSFNGAVTGPTTAVENPGSAGAASSFTDLSGFDWAKDAIASLSEKGVINGRDERTFAPAENIAREEFAALIIKAFDKITENTVSFNDVADGAWYQPYISRAAEKKIVSGYPDGSFGVGKNITREDMCVMMKRAMGVYNVYAKEVNSMAAFFDLDTGAEYARDDIMELARIGVISGTGNNSFSPKANATRAEAAVIIYRILGL